MKKNYLCLNVVLTTNVTLFFKKLHDLVRTTTHTKLTYDIVVVKNKGEMYNLHNVTTAISRRVVKM